MSREQVIAEIVAEMESAATLHGPNQLYAGPSRRGLLGWITRLSQSAASSSVGAVPQGDDVDAEWLPTIECDEAFDREYIRMAGWEVQTKGKGSTFRICDPKGDSLPIPDSPYLHDTLTRMARDIFASHIKTLTDHEATLASQAARMGELEKDAARLDWLADAIRTADLWFALYPHTPTTPEQLRSAIDKLRGEKTNG